MFGKSLSGQRRALLFLAASFLLGGVAAGTVASPAQAGEDWHRGGWEHRRDWDRGGWRGHERREHEWREREHWRREAYRHRYYGPPAVYAPPPAVIIRPVPPPLVVVPY